MILCFCSNLSFAQTQQIKNKFHKSLEVSLGLSVHSILDQMYAPFTWNSVTPNLRLAYNLTKNKGLFSTGLNVGFGTTKYKDYSLFESNLIDVDIFALYAKKVWQKDQKMNIYVGGLVDYRILFLLNMRDEFTVGNASYTAALTLGAYMGFNYQLSERQQLSVRFDLPLAGTAVRNPYTGFDQSTTIKTAYGNNLPPLIFHNPQFVHGAKFFRPRIRLSYDQHISTRRVLSFGLSAEYLSYQAINPINAFKTNFSISLNF